VLRKATRRIDNVVVDLTNGEPTPNGSEAIRKAETEKAGKILGIRHRYNLGLPNRTLEYTLDNRRLLAEVIRKEQPDILFGPALPDQHPDHVETAKLIQGARFEAKFHKTDLAGKPHWTPKLHHYYSSHRQDLPSPTIIVDITTAWKQKEKAIQAYRSQTSSPTVSVAPDTRIRTRCQYWGHSINCEYGEGFCIDGGVAVSDVDLL